MTVKNCNNSNNQNENFINEIQSGFIIVAEEEGAKVRGHVYLHVILKECYEFGVGT